MRVVLVLSLIVMAAAWTPASKAVSQDAHDRFVARCRTVMVADWPDMADRADAACEERWPSVARANPLVDILLSPFAGAGRPQTPNEVRERIPLVRWDGATPQGLEGRFGNVDALVTATAPPRLVISWGAVGEPVPYEVEDALRLRGASVDLIGCYEFGASESSHVYRVAAPGHAPFALAIYRREAPTASANSHLTVTAEMDERIPDLDALRVREPDADWRPRCA